MCARASEYFHGALHCSAMTQPDSSELSELDRVLAARFGGYTSYRPAEADAGPILVWGRLG